MNKFTKQLEDCHSELESLRDDKVSKLEFLASDVFNFITYDGGMDEFLALKMLKVLSIILNEQNHQYIKKESNYKDFILMVNMPFLVDKLEWGASIRGAWYKDYGSYEICHIKIKKGELSQFISELITFSEIKF